jgi:iron complex outermembrane recepter protein
VHIDGTPLSADATSRRFTPASASAGLVFDVNPIVRVGVTLSSAARAPAQTELFARGPHDGPGTFETGDPTLKEERANSLEGTLRIRTDTVRFEGSLWGAKFNDYIFGQLTGRTCDDEGVCVNNDSQELRELIYRQLGATFWGAEGKATFSVKQVGSGTLQVQTLADYVRATLDDGAGNVPRLPPYHVGAGLSWAGRAIDAGFLVKYSGEQTRTGIGETRTPGFTSIDAQVGWKPIVDKQQLEVVLVGHNLTDSTQRNSVALNKDEVVQPGRDVRLLVRVSF